MCLFLLKVYIIENRCNRELILFEIKKQKMDFKKCALVNFAENSEYYSSLNILHEYSLGSTNDLKQGIRSLYRILRDCDILGIENIFIEGYKEVGLGFSYMNRLKKAANHNFLKEQ